MEKKYFLKLLSKYAEGKATRVEQRFLQAYYNLFDSKSDVIAQLTDEQRLALQEDMKWAIWNSINGEETPSYNTKIRSLWVKRLSVAAIFILICSVAIILTGDFLNMTGPAMITVHNNNKLERSIKLIDGSSVTLGADSRIQYSKSFNKLNKREVYLEGNAFFDVAHNPSKPFVVHSEKVQTVVLGTAFTVEAYPWVKEITVTVKRGKVSVSDESRLQGIITPDQQIRYNKGNRVSIKGKVNATSYNNWKTGTLLFKNVTVAEAADILEKKFKIKVLFSDREVKTKRFTASFNVADSLDTILESICEFNGVPYYYDKGKALVQIGAQ